MATATKTYTFTSSTAGWSFAAWAAETGTTSGTNGLVTSLAGKNLSAVEIGNSSTAGWSLSDTFANIFGIPAGSTVTDIGSGASDGVDWLCTAFTTGGSQHTAAQFMCLDFATGTFSVTPQLGVSFTTTTSVATAALTSRSISVSASLPIRLSLESSLSTGNSNSAVMTVGIRKLVVTITYTAAGTTYTKAGYAVESG